MFAIRSDGARLLADGSAPAPELGAGQALLSLRVASLGPEDLRAASPGSGFSGVLGHECVATVERVLPDARLTAEAARRLGGARALVQSSIPCASCETCQRGLAAHCPKALLPGRRGMGGALAERFSAPASALVVVPDGVDDERAVMAYALARAMHHARVAAPAASAWITVIGDSPEAALCAALLAKDHPSARLLAREESTISLCAKWGVKHRDAAEAGRRRDQDVVVVASDSAADFALGCSLLRARGTLLLGRAPSAGVSLEELHAREARLLCSSGGSLQDALALLASGGVDVSGLAGVRRRLSDGALAFRDASQERGARKSLIVA